jgi:hypothetical protein
MKDLISGSKKYLHCENMAHLYVPQYDTLKITKIMEEASRVSEVMAHLPILKELEKVPKQWLCNVIYSVMGSNFAQWVQERVRERNERVTVLRDLNINIDPQVLAAF